MIKSGSLSTIPPTKLTINSIPVFIILGRFLTKVSINPLIAVIALSMSAGRLSIIPSTRDSNVSFPDA